LEFDTVFYYKRKSNKGNNDKENLKSYLDFDEKFFDVKKFILLFSGYDKKMIKNDLSKIIDKNAQKEEMEEINNDYVALTRAKKNLILLFDAEITDKNGYTDTLAKRMVDVYGDENRYEIGEIVESEIPEETIEQELKYILENMEVKIQFYGSEVIGVSLPSTVVLQVTETQPSIKGATVTGSGKPATMETGLVVNVPDFIEAGEYLEVNTAEGTYVRRATK